MADQSGQKEIRGIDIDKLAKGFADEENQFKRICTQTKTTAREIRWYQKTSGFLDSADTTGITASQIANVAERAMPVVVEQSWTRNTSYVRKYFVESPMISEEDIKDSDIDILATNVRDLTRAVARQVDSRIYSVLASVSGNAIRDGNSPVWSLSTSDPIADIMCGMRLIRDDNYNPTGATLLLNPKNHEDLIRYLITTKGSSIPAFSSERIKDGVVMEILGLNTRVSTNVTANEALIVIPQRACTWKEFMPITAVVMTEPGIGRKIRVWEEGEAIATDANAVCRINNTGS